MLHRPSQRAAFFHSSLSFLLRSETDCPSQHPPLSHGKHHLITSRADWEQDHETPLCPGRQKATITRAMGGACSPAELTSRRHAEIDRKARRIHSRNTQGSFERHAEINQKARQNDLRNTLKSPWKHADITRGRSGASHRRRFARPGVPAACSPYTAPHAGSTAYNRHTDS